MADTKISELSDGGQILSTDETVIVRSGTNYRTALGNINTLSVGNLTVSSGIVGTLTTAAQTNITSVGTLSALSVTGNVSVGNLTGTSLTGTLATAAQTNITSIGNLASLNVDSNIVAGNLTANGILVQSGAITANVEAVDVTQTWSNANVAFTAVRVNVADSGSDATSYLLDLEVDNDSVFTVDKGGNIKSWAFGTLTCGSVNGLSFDLAGQQTSDGNTLTMQSILIDANTVVSMTAHVVGYEASTGDAYVARIWAGVKNIAGTTTIVGNAVVDESRDAGFAGTVTANIVGNDGDDALDVVVTGEAGKTIDWTGYLIYQT